jgi:transcriptional regulator with XRE-family HTH domain
MIRNVQKLVNARQIRAARGWLGWSQDDLAAESGVGRATIARFELSAEIRQGPTLAAIQRAFEDAGVEFQFENSDPIGFLIRPGAAKK